MSKKNEAPKNETGEVAALRETVKTLLSELLNSGEFEFDIPDADLNTQANARLEAMNARLNRMQATVDALVETVVGGKPLLPEPKPAVEDTKGRLDVTEPAPAEAPEPPKAKAAKKASKAKK